MIHAFKTELGTARESQIREIFSRMGRFERVSNGELEGNGFDLICNSKGKHWLGEIKIKPVDSPAVDSFNRKCKDVKSVEKKMIFALFGIDKKAALLAKDLGMEVWDLGRINRERKKYKLSKIRV